MAKGISSPEAVPPLSVSTEQVCFIIIKAREFDVKDIDTVPDDASNPSDDRWFEVLEDNPDDPVAQELYRFIGNLNDEQQVELVALAWLGRGDGTLEEWEDLRGEAERAHNDRTAAYLMGLPLLGDYLEEGLSMFGRSCEEVEVNRL